MKRRTNVTLSAATIPIVAAVGLGSSPYRPWESPTLRAYRVCAENADLPPAEVDRQIDTVRSAPGTREAKLRIFRDQFADPADAEACEPCASALLGAVEKTEYSDRV